MGFTHANAMKYIMDNSQVLHASIAASVMCIEIKMRVQATYQLMDDNFVDIIDSLSHASMRARIM